MATCPAVIVSVKRRGWRGVVRLSFSACLDVAGGGVCGLCGVSFSRLLASGEACILILVPGCCFLLSLFLGTCLLCGRFYGSPPPPIALVQCPINRFLRGTGGSDFFINFSSHTLLVSPMPVLRLRLIACGVFTTRILGYSPAYQYRPAPRPATLDTGGGEVHGCDAADGWRRCHTCLISLVRCHPSHEMMKR